MKIQLSNGKTFPYKDIDLDYVQKILRKVYDKDNENRAYCQCNPKSPPELVLAYLRPSDHFFIRRMPGQNPLQHHKECFFRTHKPKSSHSGKNGLTLAIPNKNKTPVTDHEHAKKVLNVIWDELESTYLDKQVKTSWVVVKDLIRLIAETIDLNSKPLIDVLSVVVPKPVKMLTELDLPEGRVVMCELLGANETKTGSIRIQAKGMDNQAWLNDFRIQHLDNVTKNKLLLSKEDRDESRRYIVVMTLINGMSKGNDLHCSSVGLLEVDKGSFVSFNRL